MGAPAGIRSAWMILTNNTKELMEKIMPKTRPPSPKHRPPCMTARARLKVKEKKKCFRQWRRSIDGKDYLLYAKARNQAKWECRRAEKEFEQIIASEAKINPKALYRYARSKMKTRVRISNLTDEAGNLVTSDKDKLNFLNNLFSSVFTNEDLTNMPNFNKRVYLHHLSELDITPKMVKKKLEKLNMPKSPGSDGMHPRVISELRENIAEPLCQIYKKSLQNGQLPKEWKTGWLSPIPPKGSRLKP